MEQNKTNIDVLGEASKRETGKIWLETVEKSILKKQNKNQPQPYAIGRGTGGGGV